MAVEEVYCSLNKLLEDICRFLADESNYTKLSPLARKHADELINRSKHQLQEIAKITNECDGDAYVDMEKKSVESSDDDKNGNIYVSVDEVTQRYPTVILPPQNPYANLPARELDQDLKHGSLSWRCKIILKFEKMKKIYAGIHGNWLLVYSTEKDAKPLQTFNLQHHKAHQVPCKQGKNLSQDFEMFTTVGEKKSYYFTALTHKDMLQWVAQINRCNDAFGKMEKSAFIEEEPSETYEVITSPYQNNQDTDDDEDGEAIYYPIEDLPYKPQKMDKPPELPKIDKPPELPLRRFKKPPPEEENKEKSSESLTSTNETGKSEESIDNDSFSEEEEDEGDYGTFLPKKPEKKQVDNTPIQNAKQKNVDFTQTNFIQEKIKPVTPAKPKFLGKKPPPPLKK